MAAKRANTTRTDGAEESRKDETKPTPSKKEAVQQALALGITSPTKVSEYVKETYGVEVTPGHVSTIKGTLKREQSSGETKQEGESTSQEWPLLAYFSRSP